MLHHQRPGRRPLLRLRPLFPLTPGLWKDRLLKARAAGIDTIATCVPWNSHEPVKGQMDLSQLADFIDLCDEMSFYVIPRVGPFICAEWDDGGFPVWLLEEDISNADLRTNHNPHYVELVGQWYAAVADVLRPRLVTHGGNVVSIQVENEYGTPRSFKTDVIRKRYQMIRELGIDVPVVTCNTDCAWDNDDPIMEDIVNGNNTTVVRWSNIDVVERRTAEARRHETDAPTIVLENPGGEGMFSNLTNHNQLPLDAADFNAVNKTLWAEGAGLANYYMFYGGTNLAYTGAAYQSTTYAACQPVSCPVSESGGLLDSYYTVKLIGQWLNSFATTVVLRRPTPKA